MQQKTNFNCGLTLNPRENDMRNSLLTMRWLNAANQGIYLTTALALPLTQQWL